METGEYLIKLTNEALRNLDRVGEEFRQLSLSDRNSKKYNIYEIVRAVASIMEFQNSVFAEHPELKPPPPEDDPPDPPLSRAQIDRVARLNEFDLKEIDEALLSNACNHWRKVARVVGTTMSKFLDRYPGVPDLYYAQRVRYLVEQGKLESQGNLAYMCYSEVRSINKNLS